MEMEEEVIDLSELLRLLWSHVPVSYTHLQVPVTPSASSKLLRSTVLNVSGPPRYRTVSYTHLDVYKRQSLPC